MALVLKDRVKETTTSTGTGTITLAGAAQGFQSFSVIGNGNATYYTIYDPVTGAWEVGIGTYTASGATLSRDTVLESSNSGSLVPFGAGVKDVFVTYPAERSVYLDTAGSAVTVLDIGTLGVSTANISSANITAGTISTTPTSSNDLVNKTYVDGIAAQGISYHTPVKYEVPNTTGNLNATYNQPGGPGVGVGATLTNAGTLAAFAPDGPTASPGDRILVYNQTNPVQNGVYTVTTVGNGSTPWVLTRASDADTYGVKSPTALGGGDAFFVTSGNTGAGETYVCNNASTITFGTTGITFAQIASAQVYSAGAGLTLSNLVFSITPVGTAGTYGGAASVPVFTTNAYGQITGVTPTAIAISGAAVSGNIAGSAGSVANALTAGTYLTATGTFDGSVARTFSVDATSANTASKVVARDASGNFSAGTITATLSGNATTATTATNIAGGAANQIHYQSGAGTTTFVTAPTTSSTYLGWNGSAFTWSAFATPNSLTFNNGGAGGVSGSTFNGSSALTVSYNTVGAPSTTGTNATGTWGISISGNAATATSATSATTATNLAGGSAGTVPYQSAAGVTAMLAAGTSGQYLQSNGAAAPSWATLGNGTLTMAVSGTGLSGSASFTANQSGNSTFTVTSNATSANTASTIVARDASGNFSAGTITATLSGNSTTTSQRAFSGDISTGGQGRFTGWYTGNAATGIAAEIGMSAGEGYIFVYNRDTFTYGTLNIASSAANMQFSGGTINVSSGALQQGGNQVLHAGNYNSYALPLSGGTMTGTIYSNVGSIIIGQNGGVTRGYLYNDIGGFGFLNSSGSWQAYVPYGTSYFVMNGSARSPLFYDSENTAYYLNPYATGSTALVTRGEIRLENDSGGTTHFNYPSGGTSNYIRGTTYFDTGPVNATAGLYANIFYDSNNTAYYVDPASTSVIGGAEWNSALIFTGTSGNQALNLASYNGYVSMRVIRNNAASGFNDGMYIGYGNSNSGVTRIFGGGATSGDLVKYAGYTEEPGSFRAPIFYDSGDTSYYVNPNSTSNLYVVQLLNGKWYPVDNNSGNSIDIYVRPDNNNTYVWRHIYGGTGTGYGTGVGGYGIYAQHLGGDYSLLFNPAGFVTAPYSFRSPIFYDSGNTAYYVDPASLTYLYSLQLSGAAYFFPNSWIQLNGAYGLYAPSVNSAHFYPNNVSTYGTWAVSGARNSYSGIYDSYSAVNYGMYDSGGNGGAYREVNGRWHFYYSVANDCMGIGSSSTNSAYSLYLTKGVYAGSRIDATIFYDIANTGYYLDPASTSSLNVVGSFYLANNYAVSTDHPYGIYFDTSLSTSYAIYREAGAWTHPYPDLRIAFHTGIKIGANASYQGVRFYTDYDMSTQVMSVNNASDGLGAAQVYVNNSLQAGSSLRAPIFYDSDNTGYYIDPNGTSFLSVVSASRFYAGYDSGVTNSFSCSDWFRSSGNTGWYNASYAGGIYMIDTTWVRVYNSKAFYVENQIAATGNVTAYYSDERLKTKVGRIENALDKVRSLEGFLYVNNDLAKANGYTSDRVQVALSAQQVQRVQPEVVSLAPFDMHTDEFSGEITSKSGENYLTVDYERLVPLLVEAIKELSAKVDALH